jgi:hypothetical protein
MAVRIPERWTEAQRLSEALPGGRTIDELRSLISAALNDVLGDCCYAWICDLTDEWVAYETGSDTYQRTYTVADDGQVTFGDPAEVERRTTYDPAPPDGDGTTGDDSGSGTKAMIESVREVDRIIGRVLEAKGADATGSRIFGVQIVAYGDSKNKRRYPEQVMRAGSRLYEGAKAYDHHRTVEELTTSTINGLVGTYRNVEAGTEGLVADLVLLPSATHTAEALDASLAAQADGLEPLVGVSHDVMAQYRPIFSAGSRLMEATEIVSVNSADVVADPSAGGRPTRMVAGGNGNLNSPEEDTAMTIDELTALLKGATPDQRARALEGFGLDAKQLEGLRTTEAKPPVTTSTTTTGAGDGDRWDRNGFMGATIVRTALEARKLPVQLGETIVAGLPERFCEADVTRSIEGIVKLTEGLEKAGLTPTVAAVVVTADEQDKKIARLDAMFAGDYQAGYHSFKEAWSDITGSRPGFFDTEDINRRILRESIGDIAYDGAMRATESVAATTWNLILGDSITRRMVAEYSQPSLAYWRSIVSSVIPVNDFRTQRIDRLGGYGVLPAVAEGAPYQALTTPGNEEVTYAISKRGGIEDLTLETIANDDMRAVVRLPTKLGLAAAQTLFRFVFDLINTNPVIYDGVALFAAGHGNNTAATALGRGAVSTGRRAMRKQTAYGDSTDLLSIVPKMLLVCSDLEELAFEITQSAVAIPTAAPDGAASNIPNIHNQMTATTIDYWASTTAWVLVGDPGLTPTIELGFYRGQETPELFVQNDPQVGSAFTADKITYKIRHIYSGAILDFRAFYRGNS